jgi:DNA-binding XRE family transcriptional regulator
MSTQKDDSDDLMLGEKIKTVRKVRGYTQEKLAKHLEISKDYISRIEKGVFSRKNLRDLIVAPNCEPDITPTSKGYGELRVKPCAAYIFTPASFYKVGFSLFMKFAKGRDVPLSFREPLPFCRLLAVKSSSLSGIKPSALAERDALAAVLRCDQGETHAASLVSGKTSSTGRSIAAAMADWTRTDLDLPWITLETATCEMPSFEAISLTLTPESFMCCRKM